MDDFLRKIKLSEPSIKIYLKSLNKGPLTYDELYTIVPKISLEEFKKNINDLLEYGLLIQQIDEQKNSLSQYLAIPPILPILKYYENINTSLSNIKNSVQELLINSINEIFSSKNAIELDTILNTFQEIRNDINEDSIIQKQEIEDIVREMEIIKDSKKELTNFYNNLNKVTKTQFLDLNNTIDNFKTDLIKEIDSLDFKKHKDEIIEIIKKVFEKQFSHQKTDFINNLNNLIEDKFNATLKIFEEMIQNVLQNREDFKIQLFNMLNNFEMKMNKIYELINDKKENLFSSMKILEKIVIENLNSIIHNSINEVSNLNKPVMNVLSNYYQEISSINNSNLKLWTISSKIRMNEEIQNCLIHSKESLLIIIPNLENYLTPHQIQQISKNKTIKIISSEPHTNSLVTELKKIKNLFYKSLKNEDLILIQGDASQFVIGIEKNINGSLDNFIGIGSNFEPLITILSSLFYSLWEQAFSDTFYGTTQQKISQKLEATPPKKLIVTPSKPSKAKIQDLKKDLKKKVVDLTKKAPQIPDDASIQINSVFNNLVQKIEKLKGKQISKELEDVADLILEKKGFSVTLHHIRTVIESFKNNTSLLTLDEIKEIIQEIEVWKKKFS